MQPELVKRIFGRSREELGEAEQRILQRAHEHRIVSSNAHALGFYFILNPPPLFQ